MFKVLPTGSLRLRRLFPELRRWLDFATGRYTTSRVPSCKFDSGHLMKVAPYTIVKSGSSEMCWTCSSSVNCAFSPHRGHGGKTSPWRIQTTFSQQPLCSQRYTPETGVMLPL